MQEDVLEVEVSLHCPPAQVQAWWWEFPEEYVAVDPAEQPHRIRTLERTPDRVEVMTYWRGPLGREMMARETLRAEGENAWSADVHMMGFSIHDEFQAEAQDGGTRLRIRSSIVPVSSLATLMRPLMVERLKRQMEQTFRTAARLCDEQGAR